MYMDDLKLSVELFIITALYIHHWAPVDNLFFFVPENTSRHRNLEECCSLLRQRQNTTLRGQ